MGRPPVLSNQRQLGRDKIVSDHDPSLLVAFLYRTYDESLSLSVIVSYCLSLSQFILVQFNTGQSGIKCVIVASAMRAEQGPCEPIKGCIREIREQ